MKLPSRPSRADARVLLAELRSNLWLWRMARGVRQRRSLGMKVRWRLRYLAGTECAEQAMREVERALEARRVCGGCGRLVPRDTRLKAKQWRGLWAK